MTEVEAGERCKETAKTEETAGETPQIAATKGQQGQQGQLSRDGAGANRHFRTETRLHLAYLCLYAAIPGDDQRAQCIGSINSVRLFSPLIAICRHSIDAVCSYHA